MNQENINKIETQFLEDPIYFVKRIEWKGEILPILTQNQNGPCPFISLMNILILRKQIVLNSNSDCFSYETLIQMITDLILNFSCKMINEETKLNVEQNISDVFSVLPKLKVGLDVNVKFTGISDFEYTSEFILFDILNIRIYHGWLKDPSNCELSHAIGKLSYNQIVEKVIEFQNSQNSNSNLENAQNSNSSSNLIHEGFLCAEFLAATASQLTEFGLISLMKEIPEDELSILFRNNHFNVLYKKEGKLYLLLTDCGFLREKMVWQILDEIGNDGIFVDAKFETVLSENNQNLDWNQVENSDYFLALKIQKEEEERQKEYEKNLKIQKENEKNQQEKTKREKEKKEMEDDSFCVIS
eukprot:Sdes_comp19193_c0_seq1m10038